ncbi:MAG: Lrp/AsnC family transcriptional regulator [Bacillota bacterium]
MYFKQIDEYEAKIIKLLQVDGRIPLSKLVKEIGLAEATIRKKLRRLINDNIILVTALGDVFALGFGAPAMIGIKADRRRVDEVARNLSKFPEVQFVAITTGQYHIYIRVNIEDISRLSEFLLERIMTVEGILDTDTFVIMKIYKETGQIGVGAES